MGTSFACAIESRDVGSGIKKQRRSEHMVDSRAGWVPGGADGATRLEKDTVAGKEANYSH